MLWEQDNGICSGRSLGRLCGRIAAAAARPRGAASTQTTVASSASSLPERVQFYPLPSHLGPLPCEVVLSRRVLRWWHVFSLMTKIKWRGENCLEEGMQWLTIGELEDRAVWRVRTTLQHWSTCHRCCVLMQRRSCSWYRMGIISPFFSIYFLMVNLLIGIISVVHD